MTPEEKVLAAFWSQTRQKHLPMALPDIINRAKVKQDTAAQALQQLVRQKLIFFKTEKGGTQVYEIMQVKNDPITNGPD